MNQLITLLTNLFSLTKVASVTLPGLLAAGGLALILWPPVPVDLIPATPPPPQQAMLSFGRPACNPKPTTTDEILHINGEGQLDNKPNLYIPDPSLIEAIKERVELPGIPRMRRERIRDQFVLDFEWETLIQCAQLETSYQGVEESKIQELKTEIDNLDKQRAAAQDNYLAYLKSNSPLANHYGEQLKGIEEQISSKRLLIQRNEQDSRDRVRRASELSSDQQIIKDRMEDPGRLRPRIGFDAFLTGLVNHAVGFILLSLAAALLVQAIDQATFGVVFEDLFDGF